MSKTAPPSEPGKEPGSFYGMGGREGFQTSRFDPARKNPFLTGPASLAPRNKQGVSSFSYGEPQRKPSIDPVPGGAFNINGPNFDAMKANINSVVEATQAAATTMENALQIEGKVNLEYGQIGEALSQAKALNAELSAVPGKAAAAKSALSAADAAARSLYKANSIPTNSSFVGAP